uniref:Uncharacterized protein n=1 Tax=Anguilla anguilla TaxID=7936 RepID=A0A0E9RRA1_ANGAN
MNRVLSLISVVQCHVKHNCTVLNTFLEWMLSLVVQCCVTYGA